MLRRFTATVAVTRTSVLAGGTSTVAGSAVKAPVPADSDGAVVALLDTGSYPTAGGPPACAAGSAAVGAILEVRRMAENVVGPWRVDAKLLRSRPVTVRPLFDDDSLR